MKVISVDAPCNGSGKTSLVLSILKAFPSTFAFTKFTTIYADEQFCPANERGCACHRLQGDFNICTDAAVLSQPETDTGRVWRAGALQTLWCVSRPEGYPEMLREYTKNRLQAGIPLLVEGSTVTRYLKPTVRLVVVNPLLPKSWWKDNAERAVCSADLVVINRHQAELQPEDAASIGRIEAVLERVRESSLRGSSAPLDQWEDQRLFRTVDRLLKS